MEGQWLMLARVLRVAPAQAGHAAGGEAEVAAQVEELAAAVGDEEEDAQPQAEQGAAGEADQAAAEEADHAADGEAEVAAQDAAVHAAVEPPLDVVGPQADHAAAGEADHAAAGEAEVAEQAAAVHAGLEAPHAVLGLWAQAQLEQRVTEVDMAAGAEAAQAGHAAAEPHFTISVAPPPRVTFLTAGTTSHPKLAKPDTHPYIIAAGPFCLLARFSTHPNRGTNFGDRPRASHLVVVRHFRNGGANGEIVATAERVPSRARSVPALNNVEGVGFLCNAADRTYRIAELRVITGPRFHSAVLVSFRSGGGRWSERKLDTPRALRGDRAWTPHGTVAVDNTIIWFDLSWGMLTCDDLDHEPRLHFYALPPGRALGGLDSKSKANIHTRRCIALSGNIVRYVEIIVPGNGEAAATVSMWHRVFVEDKGWRWSPNYSVSFDDIWNHPSYAATALPQNAVPDLVCVSPANPSVIYFALDQRLFGVDVPNHMVLHCEGFELVDVPLQRRQASARFIVPWNLHAAEDYNIGYLSQEPYVTLPEDVSDDEEDEVVQDLDEQSNPWDRRGSKSIKITPMKISRRQ